MAEIDAIGDFVLSWAIADALERACIEIPFPQMDVRLRSLFGEERNDALKTLRLEVPERRAAAEPVATVNDAAEDLARPSPEVDDADDPTASRSPNSPAP